MFFDVVLVWFSISPILLSEAVPEKIDFKKIFHTPPRDYDKLEILERSSFEPDDPAEENKLVKTEVHQPKAVANAQVLFNIDNEDTARTPRDNHKTCPYLSQYGPYYPPYPHPMYHPQPYFHPFCMPPCFVNLPREFIRRQSPMMEGVVPEKEEDEVKTIEKPPKENYQILTSKEPIGCLTCGGSSDGKFCTDVDGLMVQNVEGNGTTDPPCPHCAREGRLCQGCAAYTKELNDI